MVKVSVVIPTYKRPETLCRAVDSVLRQELKEVEVIVVDDNQPTSIERRQTEEVMGRYMNDCRVKYIKHDKNYNGAVARNTGIKTSSGEYVAFLDDDDEFTPQKLKSQSERLDNCDSSWAACYTRYEIRRDDQLISKGVECREGQLLTEALKRNLFICAGSNLMVRRSVLVEIGGFNETFRRNQDLEILVRILAKYAIAYSDVMGLIVHEHIGNKVDFEQVTSTYVSTFLPAIEALPHQDRKEVYKMINLQRFRYWFFKGRWGRCLNIMRKHQLSVVLIARYLCHLMDRRIKRESRGFIM